MRELPPETRSSAAPDAHAGAQAADLGASRLDLPRILFWLTIFVTIMAAAVVAVLLPQMGILGRVFLIGIGAFAILLLVWIMQGSGRRLGLFPDIGGAELVNVLNKRAQYGFLEALVEPALVTERSGLPIAANQSYLEIAESLGAMGESERPASLDVVFGSSPGFSGPIFRLTKAAKSGRVTSELLPAVSLGEDREPRKFEALVSPLPGGKILWRLRLANAASGDIATRSLYLDDAPIGFFSAAADGRILYLNATLRAWLGLGQEGVNPKIKDILRADPGKLLRRDRRGPQRTEAMLRPRDGVEIPAVVVTTWLDEQDGDAVSRSVVFTPNIYSSAMAQRLSAESPLRPSRGSGDGLFESIPFGAAQLSGEDPSDSLIEDANPALLNLSAGRALIGARFGDLFLADQGAAALAAKIRNSVDRPQELQLAGDDPRTVHVSITQGKDGLIAYLVDLTEKKKLEERLFQSEKLQSIGQLSGKLAHEFNNWLTAIRLRCDKLFIRHSMEDPSFESIYTISQIVNEASEVVRALLTYSRRETFVVDVLDVSEVFSGYLLLLRQLLEEGIQIEMRHGRDLPMIKADRNYLFTVIMNLVINARDAMMASKGSGEIIIKTSRSNGADAQAQGFSHVLDGDYLLIEVSDNGPGIAPDVIGKIFEPFFSTKEQGKGTGLGLATVWGGIKQSGGFIYPVSQLGKGTTFKIYLPAVDSDHAAESLARRDAKTLAAQQQPAAPEPIRHNCLDGRGRILFVEDEDRVRDIAVHLLESCGYEVVQAADGLEAMDVIREQGGIDLVITDVRMPGMDGPALLTAARPHLGERTPIVFITGYTEHDFEKLLSDEKSGRVSLLRKPFTLSQLAERVRDELARAAN